jgi:Fic/DOC family protein
MARPQQQHAYRGAPDIVDLGAIHTAGIVHNRPFVDGNTRTGLVAGIAFLELNGYRLTASLRTARRRRSWRWRLVNSMKPATQPFSGRMRRGWRSKTISSAVERFTILPQ